MVDILTIFTMIGIFAVGLLALTFCIFLLGCLIEVLFFAGWLGFKGVRLITKSFRKDPSSGGGRRRR